MPLSVKNTSNNGIRFRLFPILLTALLLPGVACMAGDNDGLYKFRTVVIDAGHGGKDPGAIGYSKVKEKDVALSVSLLLGQYLSEYLEDMNVLYTRKDDRFIELHERAKVANENNADLFVSIHCNSTNSSQPYGTETWVLGLHRANENLEIVKRENSVIELEENAEENYLDPNSPEFHIQVQIRQSAYLEKSIQLASKVEDQFVNRVFRKSRGVKQAGFVVLYKTTMPSILVELGFLSNQKEEEFLASEEGQVYLASAIFRAIKEYKLEVEEEANIVQSEQEAFEKNLAEMAQLAALKEDITFKVQLMASEKPLKPKSPAYSTYGDLVKEQQIGKLYRYYIYEADDYNDIKLKAREVRAAGFKDAFIVAFRNGKRIRVQEALKALQN